MPDDGITGHLWTGDAQIVAAHGPADITNDHTAHFYDAPSDTANVVTPTAGTMTTQVWKRIYQPHTLSQGYQMVFTKGQVVTSADIAIASADSFTGF